MIGIEQHSNLEIAITAAIEAGSAIMEVYNADLDVEYKEDNSPLTQADKNANAVINSYLKSTNIPIISEENKQIEFDTRKQWEVCWIVDPVDGTKEFIKRNGEFTVNIALVKNGTPVLGVIYVPEPKILYYTENATGKAYKLSLTEHKYSKSYLEASSAELKPSKEMSNTVRVVGSRSHMNKETMSYVEHLKHKGYEVEIVSKGSSLKFCLVAEGKADVYPRFAPTMEWDTAAGQAICNAVGITVISKATNKPLLYNKENLLNPWFLVSKEM